MKRKSDYELFNELPEELVVDNIIINGAYFSFIRGEIARAIYEHDRAKAFRIYHEVKNKYEDYLNVDKEIDYWAIEKAFDMNYELDLDYNIWDLFFERFEDVSSN